MTTYELDTPPPFPSDVEAMLDHERSIAEVPAIVRARLMARAKGSLKAPDALFSRPARPSLLRPIWLAAAAGVMFVTTVAAAVQFFRRSEQPTLPVVATPPKPAVAAEPLPELAPAPSPSPTVTPRANSPVRADMVEELRFLDRARQADARGDYSAVLAFTNEHERRFQHGRLAEDREVLRMRAYVGLSRGNDARSTAAKFRRQFPRSVLLPKIDDLLGRLR